MADSIRRPALRYHGGKFRLAEWVIEHFPKHLAYVEPFGGAASVLLQKPPSRIEVYNDLDDQIVDFFAILRDPEKSERLRTALELTPFSRTEFNKAFRRHRNSIERARRLVIRSFQGVGANAVQNRTRSGWRVRTAAHDRNAYSFDWSRWPDEIPQFVTRLKDVQIECSDWRKVVEINDHEDVLFYCDPPYPRLTRSADHRCVYRHEMSDEEHGELCRRMIDVKGFAILSSYRNPIYDEILLPAGFEIDETPSRAQTNADRMEALYLSPATVKALREEALQLSLDIEEVAA